jgi:hypothetical protein
MGSVILTGIQVLGLATAIAVSTGFCQTRSWDYIRRQTGFPGTDSGRSDRVLIASGVGDILVDFHTRCENTQSNCRDDCSLEFELCTFAAIFGDLFRSTHPSPELASGLAPNTIEIDPSSRPKVRSMQMDPCRQFRDNTLPPSVTARPKHVLNHRSLLEHAQRPHPKCETHHSPHRERENQKLDLSPSVCCEPSPPQE